jgi:hypothetical protein
MNVCDTQSTNYKYLRLWNGIMWHCLTWKRFPFVTLAVAAVHDNGAALQLPPAECIIQEVQLFVAGEIFREQVTIDPISCGVDMARTLHPVSPELAKYGDNYSWDNCVQAGLADCYEQLRY